VAALTFVAAVAAQSPPPDGLCFHARPGVRCRWFLVTEAGFIRRLAPVYPYREMMGTGALGVMRNVGARTAVGGALVVHTNFDDRVRIGVTPRLRRWLGSWLSVDAAAGPVFSTTDGRGVAAWGGTSQLGINIGGWVTLRTQLDYVPPRDRYGGLSDPIHWSVGAAVESYPGAAGIIAGLVAVAARSWADAWSGL
jgi:hypothetical protein